MWITLNPRACYVRTFSNVIHCCYHAALLPLCCQVPQPAPTSWHKYSRRRRPRWVQEMTKTVSRIICHSVVISSGFRDCFHTLGSRRNLCWREKEMDVLRSRVIFINVKSSHRHPQKRIRKRFFFKLQFFQK